MKYFYSRDISVKKNKASVQKSRNRIYLPENDARQLALQHLVFGCLARNFAINRIEVLEDFIVSRSFLFDDPLSLQGAFVGAFALTVLERSLVAADR